MPASSARPPEVTQMNVHATTTPTRTAAEQALVDGFAARVSDFPGDAATVSARDEAVERLKAGLPTRKVEAWHYTDLRRLLAKVPPHDPTAGVEPLAPVLPDSAILAVRNGIAEAAPAIEGIEIVRVAEALAEGRMASLAPLDGDDVVTRLNTAFVTDGFDLLVAEGQDIATSLELQNLHAGGQVHARFGLKAGRGSTVTVVERQAGTGEALSSSVSEVTVEDDASVRWLIVQEQDAGTSHMAQFRARLGRNARLTLFIMNAGGRLVRQEVRVDQSGEGSDFQLRGVNLLAGEGHTDVTMVLDHSAPHTTSTELLRNVATDRAHGVFQGQIRVDRIAQKTDARMACNTLLLSDDAEFSTKPELEIFADDVACGHGATVTEIDHDHLFYLMARGVDEKTARGLLVKAFLREVVEELDDEPVVEALEAKLDQWFAEHG
ncbi:MAG: Fe-S cluster assembly protein SufD [Rhizobiaceae bacterium]|nr:Fe-S cluster assembly protein SufD [Rhizobiaceae bacterium]MCV0407171.1 Fe-S cluster assembly protein SufD [Rhizobiaceae bacterium]